MLNINSLTKIKNVNKGLFFDLKRAGDYEQVNMANFIQNTNGANIILLTIDILCSLYARTKRQNNIWHYGEKIVLYRFPKLTPITIPTTLPTTIPTPTYHKEYYDIRHKSITIINECQILKKLIGPNSIFNDIVYFNRKIINYWNNGIYIDNLIKQNITQRYCELLINIIIKFRILDLIILLNNFKNKYEIQISTAQSSLSNNYLNNVIYGLKTYSELDINDTRINIRTEIRKANDIINDVSTKLLQNASIFNMLNEINDLFNLTPNEVKILKTGENPLGLDYDFYTADSIRGISFLKFKYSGNNNQLNFSNNFFYTLYGILNKLDRIFNSSSRYPKKKNIDEILQTYYFPSINSLYSSFHNDELRDSLRKILKPNNGVVDINYDYETWWKSLSKKLNKLLIEWKNKITYIPLNQPKLTLLNSVISSSGGNKKYYKKYQGGQTNTQTDIVQIYSLSNLLRTISGTAAQFIESLITESLIKGKLTSYEQTKLFINNLIDILKEPENFKICIEVMNNIKFLLSDGLMTVQNDSNDVYRYNPTQEEFILLYFMSISSYDVNKTTQLSEQEYAQEEQKYGEYEGDEEESEEGDELVFQPIQEGESERDELVFQPIQEEGREEGPSEISIELPERQQSLEPGTNQLYDYYYLNLHMIFYANYYEILTNPLKYQTNIRRDINVDITNIIYGQYLTSDIPAEIINLLILTLFDNIMQDTIDELDGKKKGYFINLLWSKNVPNNNFDSNSNWSRLLTYFYSFIMLINTRSDIDREIINLFGGKKHKSSSHINKTKKNKKIKNINKNKNNKKTKKNKMKN